MSHCKVKRHSGIELLRIVALLVVIYIHFRQQIDSTVLVGSTLYINNFFRSLSACAVDVFLIITGYFMCTNKTCKLSKVVDVLLQVVLYTLLTYLLLTPQIELNPLILAFIPTSYYVMFYVVLYLLSPYLNRFIHSLDPINYKKFVLLSFTIFSVISILSLLFKEITSLDVMGINTIGAWGSQQGFNIVNFILLYFIGAYLRFSECKISIKKLLFALGGVVFLIFVWSMINENFHTFGSRSAWCYDNPLVIMYAVLMFLIFKNMTFESQVVNSISKSVLAGYLIHSRCTQYMNATTLVEDNMFLSYVMFVILMIIISYIIFNIYSIFYKHLGEKIDRVRLSFYPEEIK